MPSIADSMRKQKAVLWAYHGQDDYNEPTVEQPVEIDVRWEELRREIITREGTPQAIDVSVQVGQEIAERSVLWLGELVDLPSTMSKLFVVVSYEEARDIKGRDPVRFVLCRRSHDRLPDTVGT